MDNYSSNVVDSLKVFFLLRADIGNSVYLLEEKHGSSVNRLAYKSLYIDLCSFIDELNFFVSTLYNEDFDDLKAVNRFLLISHKARKALNKRDKIISSLRNTIFAHNYRDKAHFFTDPLTSLLINYKEAPFLREELQYLGDLAMLIINLALRCFHFNADLAFISLKTSSEEFEQYYPAVEATKTKVPELSVEYLERDIYQIEDTLKSHNDNFQIMAKKLKCKVRSIKIR